MSRWTSFKNTLLLAMTSWRLWLVQFFGNVMASLIFVWFLRVPDAHWWQIVFGLFLLVFSIAVALVLHGGTLDFFQIAHGNEKTSLPVPFQRALRHLPALVLWGAIFFALQWLLGKLDQYDTSFPGYLRSEFPAWLRRMISEPRLDGIYTGLLWLLRWVILPGLFLPFALFCADRGSRGFISLHDWWRVVRSVSYWIVLLIAALIGVLSTQALMGWKLDPRTATLGAEKVSLFFRLLFAYLLGIFAWFLACSTLGRRTAQTVRESDAQPV